MVVKRTSYDGHETPERMIGALLRIPFQETVRRVVAAVAEAGFLDLRPAHLAVFQHLDPGGTRQTVLADRAQITKQSMGYLVEHLVASAYVERVPDPADRRASLVRLTRRGESVVQVARAALASLEQEWAGALGPARYADMKASLVVLAFLVDPPADDG